MAKSTAAAAASCLALGLVAAFLLSIFAGVRMMPDADAAAGGGTSDIGHALPSSDRGDHHRKQRKQRHRIAIVIPYMSPPRGSPGLPPYFEIFAQTAAGSSSLVDFLIFHDGIPEHALPPPDDLPSNVKLIDLGSTEELAELLLRVADRRGGEGAEDGSDGSDGLELSRPALKKALAKTLQSQPYILVEYKPATGHIFASYLSEYTHWGYSDMDIAWGDLPRWVTEEELTEWDIVTYGFGDQDRAYLRGQFTFHRNADKINQLWRGCGYLSEIDRRYARAFRGEEKFRLESAEGCYSSVVLRTTDVRVKFAVKALTDAEGDGADSANVHGLHVGVGGGGGGGGRRDRSVVWTAGLDDGDGRGLLRLPPDWFERPGHPYADPAEPPLQWEVGPRTVVRTHRDVDGDGSDVRCMYWAPKTYQKDICVVDVDWFTDTVMLIDGTLYKQKFERVKFPENVVSYPFFHFQEWKRYYRAGQLKSLRRRGAADLAGWVLTGDGVLPLPRGGPPTPVADRVADWLRLSAPSYGASSSSSSSSPSSSVGSSSLPPTSFCLRSSLRKVAGKSPATRCDEAVSWRDESTVAILSVGKAWEDVDPAADVTLVLTVQVTLLAGEPAVPVPGRRPLDPLDGLLDVAESNVAAWGRQPSILLLHVGGATKETAARVQERFQPGDVAGKTTVKPHLKSCLVAAIFSQGTDAVSRKGLLNMATEAARTRWTVSGLEVERGLLISNESSLFARRAASIYKDIPGSAFIVPQFATMKGVAVEGRKMEREYGPFHPISVTKMLHQSVLVRLSTLDCNVCSHIKSTDLTAGAKLVERTIELWRDLTRSELSETSGVMYSMKDAAALAKVIDDIEVSFSTLLNKKYAKPLRHFDQSPILMVDSLGPRNGVLTHHVAPEVEEFGGSACYNALRLAQLAAMDYIVNVLPGAFALSTNASRAAVCEHPQLKANSDSPGSRCSGCFMFDDEDLLMDLAMDERIRPAKAAVLWRELDAVRGGLDGNVGVAR